jgi:hypothetical protein
VKTSIAIKTKQARAEAAFKRANPGWTVLQPWTAPLAPQFNKAEPMLAGKFDAVGPLGNRRNVWATVYEDGIRIF